MRPGRARLPGGAAALLCAALLAGAAQAGPDADRMQALTTELRCVVCQNESLADSQAPLALDLKREIRARMDAGDSDEQIRRFLVERYGDFVTYRPPLDARTVLLWFAPLLLAVGGGVALWRSLRAPGPEEGSS